MILAFSFALRMTFIHVPLDRDEGWYGYLGQEILRGAVPYKDAIEQKPPGIFYIYAFIAAFLGKSPESVRLFAAFYTMFTVFFVYRLTRYCCSEKAGLWAAFFFGIFSSGPLVEGSGGNTEVFMVLPLVVGAYLFLLWTDNRKLPYLVGSGIAAALALVVKTVALPLFLLILGFLFFIRATEKSVGRAFVDMLFFLLPSIFLLSLLCAYFFYHGAWEDFVYWNVTFNKAYSQTNPMVFISRLTSRGLQVSSEHALLWLLALPTSIWLLLRDRNYKNVFLVLLVVSSFVGVSMPGKFWPHYFIPMIPSLSVLAGIGMAKIWDLKGAVLWVVIPVILAAFFYTIKIDYKYFLIYTPEEVSINKFKSDVFVNAAKVARYVEARTSPSDYIFQWGWEPEIYFLSGRRPPNRFCTHSMITLSRNPEEALTEMVISLLQRSPKYIVVQGGRERWLGYAELSDILARYYYPEAVLGGMTIYRFRNI